MVDSHLSVCVFACRLLHRTREMMMYTMILTTTIVVWGVCSSGLDACLLIPKIYTGTRDVTLPNRLDKVGIHLGTSSEYQARCGTTFQTLWAGVCRTLTKLPTARQALAANEVSLYLTTMP